MVSKQLFNEVFHFSEGDPSNYLTYFKRGTVYLALGKAKNALSDLDLVIELKPDFTAARLSRGTIHLKQADYDLAQLDFYNVVSFNNFIKNCLISLSINIRIFQILYGISYIFSDRIKLLLHD